MLQWTMPQPKMPRRGDRGQQVGDLAISERYEVGAAAPRLTIIIPTLNERGNIEPLLALLAAALPATPWEAIFVDDDSCDRTAELVRAIARRDARVRCLQRIGRRGLATACIEGVLASAAPYVAVIDADLQHDEQLLPRMLATARRRRRRAGDR